MKCISNPRSVGIAEPLLVLKLCFPLDLWDLWSVRGVGRSLCDYCLHTDLYLTFNYLRGSAACWCQYIPSFGTRRGGKGVLSGFHPTHSLCPLLQDLKKGSTALRAAPRSSPEQSRRMSLTFIPSVGSERRLYGNMKLLSTGHVTLTNTPQRPINYMVVRATQITSLSPSSLVTLYFFFFYGVLYCEITVASSHFSNKLLILPTHLVFSFHT